MKNLLILALLSVSMNVTAQNKSFTASFEWQSFAAGQSNHLSKPVTISYDLPRRVVLVSSGDATQNYEVVFAEFKFGSLLLKTDIGVYVCKFDEKMKVKQVSFFSVGLHFKMAFTKEKVIFPESPNFGSEGGN